MWILLKTFGITELDEKQFDMLMEMAEKELPFEEKNPCFIQHFPFHEVYEKELSWNQLRPDRAEMLCHNPAGNI